MSKAESSTRVPNSSRRSSRSSSRKGSFTTTLLFSALAALVVLVLFFSGTIKDVLFNSGDRLDNLKASLCESQGIRTRCQASPCEGAWKDWFGDQYCSEGYWCCRLDNVDEYFPPGTVLLDADGKLDATFRVEPSVRGQPESEMTLEFGRKEAEEWIKNGIPKDVKLTVRYKPEPQSQHGGASGQRTEMPSKCSTKLTLRGSVSWNSKSVPCTQLDSFGFVKRDDAISPVEIARKKGGIVGASGSPVPLTIRIGYTMPGSKKQRQTSPIYTPDTYVVKISTKLE